MRAAFRRVASKSWQQSEEILDLTAPATEGDGLVAKWLRLSLANSAPDPAYLLRQRPEETAV
jgi:hypothetical protein